jgi:cell division septation protein DedD
MSESNFREIQLNTKQVVFLFMACVVALLGVFLLGVQVGHGVSNDGTTAAAGAGDPANEAPAPTVLPPATTPKSTDFSGIEQLAGKGDVKAAPSTPPNPSADVPPETAPTAKPTETAAPKATPAAAAPANSARAEKPGSATAIWYVQTNSFSSKDNAQKELNLLKSQGHEAFVFTAPGGGARFKTRIGPMERNAADALKNRLSREGFRPTVIK